MKTFEIFLQNGTVARVCAAKMEWRASTLLFPDGGAPVLALLDESGVAVAEFLPTSEACGVIGLSSSPSP